MQPLAVESAVQGSGPPRTDAPWAPGSTVVTVEVILFRLLPDGGLGHRVLTGDWTSGSGPDRAALEIVGIAGPADGAARGRVSHSTSWRFSPPGQVVLTYAVLPDPDPSGPAEPFADPGVLSSGDPLLPTPAGMHTHHVVAHAVRHLAGLARTDPAVRAAAAYHRELWQLVGVLADATRVGTHADLHGSREPSRT